MQRDTHNPITTAFENLLGRKATEEEIARLYGVKKTLGIRDNDALWVVIMALESYHTQLNRLPEKHLRKLDEAIEHNRGMFEAIAEAEAQKNFAALTSRMEQICETALAAKTQGVKLAATAWSVVGLVLMGTICFAAGIVIGSGRLPFWLDIPYKQGLAGFILTMIAQTPAGWILAISGCLLSFNMLCQHGFEMKGHRKPALVIGALCLFGLSLSFMLPLL